MPPSESSCIRQVGREAAILHYLRNSLGLPVAEVHVPESGASAGFVIVALRNPRPGQARQAIYGSVAHDPTMGIFTIVVDDDIDIRDIRSRPTLCRRKSISTRSARIGGSIGATDQPS